MKIENTTHPIYQRFFIENNLSIPRYQREYAWSIDHVEGLLETLFDKTNWDMYLNDPKEQYFMGTVLTYQNDKINIIDGQQRTISFYLIFLGAFRILKSLLDDNELMKLKYKEVEENYEDYNSFLYRIIVLNDDLKKIFKNQNFELKGKDNDVINKILNDKPIVGSLATNKVFVNFEYISKSLKVKYNQNIFEFLQAIEFALNKIVILQVNLHTYEEAIEIFVSLNTNREELKINELLNSLFIKDSPIEESEIIADRFNTLENEIQESGNIVEFIINYWFTKVEKKISQDEIYREITKYIKTHSIEKKSIQILEDLENMKNSYLLASGSKEFDLFDDNEDNVLLDKIIKTTKENSFKQNTPIFMKVIRKFELNLISKEDVLNIFKMIFDMNVYVQLYCGAKSQTFEAFIKKIIKDDKLEVNKILNEIKISFSEYFNNIETRLTDLFELDKESKKEFTFLKWKELIINKHLPVESFNKTTVMKLITRNDVENNTTFNDGDERMITSYVFSIANKLAKNKQDKAKNFEERITLLKENNIKCCDDIEILRQNNKIEVETLTTYLSKYKKVSDTNL